ncbi:predicted protein [Chaetomium globosum CBS 148.51]|uniref:Uncharacterized protein n=1 Tax=Chaetomium globosum (strain ATCC 6205 / CBS 148.51 / DSM 1962 / NBRC 6347 / NRRL 1970) TaxID=306901 RepID=Q2H3J9_CHAGB|nr:uncharacterized protein CHGG_06766 [Chaetomium globosum CBS 148.51]EAQ90147.1 predicted protein [Chaetomium globosum CBS 148.51]
MSRVLGGGRLCQIMGHRRPCRIMPLTVSTMPSPSKASRPGCRGHISLAVLRTRTALLASPPFGRWNHDYMAMRHHMQPNSITIHVRTCHTAGRPRNEDDLLAPAAKQKVAKLLRQGYRGSEIYNLADIARCEIPQWVFLAMLKEDKELASLMRERKRGKWSDEEKEHLIKLTHNRRRINIESIARQIGREPDSVRSRLRLMAKKMSVELGNEAVSFSVESLDGDLGNEEQSILEARMCHVIDGMLKKRDLVTTQWKAILSAKSTEAWVATILPLIPTRVKHILAAPSPPTAADWRNLTWQDTSRFGVYAWLLKRGGSGSLNPLRVEKYLYIGSATKYGHGLFGRALQHRERHGRNSGSSLDNRIKQRGLSRATGYFATLLVTEAASLEIGDITKARELVVFAEAILTVWLEALTETESAGAPSRAEEHRRLHSLSPWNHPQQFSYKGLCSHSPLALDLESRQESAHLPEVADPGQSEDSGTMVDNRATEN